MNLSEAKYLTPSTQAIAAAKEVSSNDLITPPSWVRTLRNANDALILSAIVYWYLPSTKTHTAKITRRLKGDKENFWLTKTTEQLVGETGLTVKEVKDALKRLEFYEVIHKRAGGAAGKKTTFIRLDCVKGDSMIAGRDTFIFPSDIAEKVEQARHGIRRVTSAKTPLPSGENTLMDTSPQGGKVPHGTIQKFHMELSNTEVSFSEVTEVQESAHTPSASANPPDESGKINPNTLTLNPKDQTPTSLEIQKETNPEIGEGNKKWMEPKPQYVDYAFAAVLRVKAERRAHFAKDIAKEQKAKKPNKGSIAELQTYMDAVPVSLNDDERNRLEKMAGYAAARYGDPMPFFAWLTIDTWFTATWKEEGCEVRPNGCYLMKHRDTFFEAYEKSPPMEVAA